MTIGVQCASLESQVPVPTAVRLDFHLRTQRPITPNLGLTRPKQDVVVLLSAARSTPDVPGRLRIAIATRVSGSKTTRNKEYCPRQHGRDPECETPETARFEPTIRVFIDSGAMLMRL